MSGEHATIHYDDQTWKVRDLGSRNGTFLNGVAIRVGRSVALHVGDEIRFGGVAAPPWTLQDSTPPVPMALGQSGQCVQGDANGLWLPTNSEPSARVRRSRQGWVVDESGGLSPTQDGAVIAVNGEKWTLCLPPLTENPLSSYHSTQAARGSLVPSLCFRVSLDEEHVEIEIDCGERTFLMAARAHNYPLLVLARRRLQEPERLSEDEKGWLNIQTLRDMLRLDRTALNLQLWRAAQSFTKLGLPGTSLIERRASHSQLRIGLECTVHTVE